MDAAFTIAAFVQRASMVDVHFRWGGAAWGFEEPDRSWIDSPDWPDLSLGLRARHGHDPAGHAQADHVVEDDDERALMEVKGWPSRFVIRADGAYAGRLRPRWLSFRPPRRWLMDAHGRRFGLEWGQSPGWVPLARSDGERPLAVFGRLTTVPHTVLRLEYAPQTRDLGERLVVLGAVLGRSVTCRTMF